MISVLKKLDVNLLLYSEELRLWGEWLSLSLLSSATVCIICIHLFCEKAKVAVDQWK